MSKITHMVRLKNHSGAKVAEFVGRGLRGSRPGGIQSWVYQKRLCTAGSFTLYFQGDDARLDLFTPDCQIEFWRRDPYIPAAYIATLPLWMRDAAIPDWYKDFEGFVRTKPIFEQLDDGSYQAIVRGRGYNDLFSSEPIMYNVGSAQALKTGPAETVAKAFVNENIGPGAGLDANGNSRVRPGLTVEADGATGAAWSGDRAYKQLNDVLRELGDAGPGDYMLIGTGAAAFEFKWRDGQWGLDHTATNVLGNVPIIFSSRLNSASRLVYEANYLNDVNAVNIIGQGVGDNAKVRIVTGANLALSPWARRAVVIQDKQQADDTRLDDKARAQLDDKQAREQVDAVVNQTTAIRYGPDYDFNKAYFDYGSLVTVEVDRNNTRSDKKIVGVTISIKSSSNDMVETITPEFEDVI